MKKRKQLTASLVEKSGRYYALIRLPSVNGTQKTKWRSLGLAAKHGNRRIAEDRLEELKYKLREIMSVPGYAIKFKDYLRAWVQKKREEVEESTYNAINYSVEGKILPFFEPFNLALSEVKPKHLNDLYHHLYLHGNKTGEKGLSISTLKSIKNILHAVFCQAIIDGLVRTNPCESVALPAKDNPRKHHNTLNIDSANRLLGFVQEDPLMYPLLYLTLQYGLRKSEALGIKWSAIDFEKRELRIESVIVAGTIKEKDRTKTETSRRSFPLPDDVKEILMIRKEDQEHQKEILGDAYHEPIYVFTKPNGDYLNPDWVTQRFNSILEECGLPPMRFHDLRHSTANILYDNGMDILRLQEWMRHGKLSMTSDVYLHISEEHEKKMAAKINDMLEEPESPGVIGRHFEKANKLFG